jgi:hypothetical protein
MRRFCEDWLRSWDRYLAEAETIVNLGRGVLFCAYHENASPAGGEGRIEQHVGQVGIWANGKRTWVKNHQDPDEALAAAERLAAERADG